MVCTLVLFDRSKKVNVNDRYEPFPNILISYYINKNYQIRKEHFKGFSNIVGTSELLILVLMWHFEVKSIVKPFIHLKCQG